MKAMNVVNEAKRTCAVILTNCEADAIRKMRKATRQFNEDFFIRGERSFIEDKYVGIAKCAPEDVFDAEVGLTLARDRAYKQYNRAFDNEIARVIDKMEDAIGRLEACYKDR